MEPDSAKRPAFSHLDAEGRPSMVNVGDKPATLRLARASCFLRLQASTLSALKDKALPKGDALVVAQVAGIQAAKQTPHLIPLCHALEARHIDVHFYMEDEGVRVVSEVGVVAPTGPEMEALVACSIAGLTLYDMCKAVDKSMVMESVKLEFKSGGKSGHAGEGMTGRLAAVLVLSDRASRGVYEDRSGPAAARLLENSGFILAACEVVPDDLELIVERLKHFCDGVRPDLLLTLGSTGLSPRDVAPEALQRVADKQVPGLMEAFRARTFARHPQSAVLSRAGAALRGKTLIVNLPGKPSAVGEGLEFLLPVLPHAFRMMEGEGH